MPRSSSRLSSSKTASVPTGRTTSSGPLPFAAFTPFPRLPIELRTKIWAHTIERRVVHIEWSRQLRQCITTSSPAILHVSQEARKEGLKMYEAAFNTTPSSPRVIYFNFDLDTACFQWDTFRRKPLERLDTLTKDCRRLKYMSIDGSARLDYGLEKVKFDSLQELTMAGCSDEVPAEFESLALFEWAFQPWLGAISPVDRRYLVPVLRCDKGDRCRDHWWFSAWNERWMRRMNTRQELLNWQLTFSVINDMASGVLRDRERRLSEQSSNSRSKS